jgi:hypothetical protein
MRAEIKALARDLTEHVGTEYGRRAQNILQKPHAEIEPYSAGRALFEEHYPAASDAPELPAWEDLGRAQQDSWQARALQLLVKARRMA